MSPILARPLLATSGIATRRSRGSRSSRAPAPSGSERGGGEHSGGPDGCRAEQGLGHARGATRASLSSTPARFRFQVSLPVRNALTSKPESLSFRCQVNSLHHARDRPRVEIPSFVQSRVARVTAPRGVGGKVLATEQGERERVTVTEIGDCSHLFHTPFRAEGKTTDEISLFLLREFAERTRP